MQRKILIALLLTTALTLAGLILVRKSHKQDEIKSDLKEGFGINDYYIRETQKRWGSAPIELAGNQNLAQIIRDAIQVKTPSAVDTAVIEGIQRAVLDFLDAYSDGTYDAIKGYRLKQTSLIDPDFLAKQAARANESFQILKKNIAEPLFSKPSSIEEPRLVNFSSESDRQLRELYTNRIKLALLNEIAAKAYKSLDERTVSGESGVAILALVNGGVSNRLEQIEHGRNFHDFTTPWEKLSSQMLNIQLFSTNRFPNVFTLNASLLSGLHRDSNGLFGYDAGPDEIAKEQGSVYFAIFQTAIKPKGLEYFGPITASFFYNPKDNKWHLYQFACHAQISPSVPF